MTINKLSNVAWSPDSQKIVSGSFDEMLRIWDAHTGKQIGDPLISHIGRVYVEWNSDGRIIAYGDRKKANMGCPNWKINRMLFTRSIS